MVQLGKSLIQSSVAYFGQLGISLALVVIVSRILPPAEVGSYLMAYSVVLLLIPLRDFQLQAYVIQRPDISPASLEPVAFASVAGSALGLLACLVAAALFHAFHPAGEIALCLVIMSIAFAVRPLSQVPMAMLARDMHHGAIAAIRLTGAMAKLGVTLGLLALGWGAEALAWGVVAEAAVEISAIALVARRYRVVRPVARGVSEVVRYCLPYTGAHLAITLSVSLTALLIGGFQGLAMAAFYNRGRMVMQLFRSGIEGAVHLVVLRHFSQDQADRAALKRRYLDASAMLTALTWPALAWLIIVAQPLTLTLFGPQWLPTASLLQILSVGALVYAASALSQQLHAAIGETRQILHREVWLQLPYLLLLLAVAPVSAHAVAGASVIAALLGFALHQRLLHKAIGLSIGELGAACRKSAIVAGTVAISGWVADAAIGDALASSAILAIQALLGATVWLAALAASRHPLWHGSLPFLVSLRRPS